MSGPTKPTEEYFDKGGWGFDGTRWRKLNLTWGYYDTLHNQVYVGAAVLGNNDLVHTVVPAGEVWILKRLSLANVMTAAVVLPKFADGTYDYQIENQVTLGVNVWTCIHLDDFVLHAGEWYHSLFTLCAAGDVLFSILSGYKMKVA